MWCYSRHTFRSTSLCASAEQGECGLPEPDCVPSGSDEQHRGPEQASPQPPVRRHRHRGQSTFDLVWLKWIGVWTMDESSLCSSPAGGGRGALLGLPGGWRQLGEAAPSDGRDKQTHSAPHSRVALSQPAVLGSVFWDQGTELVLPCQDPAPALQHGGGKYVLFWSCCCCNSNRLDLIRQLYGFISEHSLSQVTATDQKDLSRKVRDYWNRHSERTLCCLAGGLLGLWQHSRCCL